MARYWKTDIFWRRRPTRTEKCQVHGQMQLLGTRPVTFQFLHVAFDNRIDLEIDEQTNQFAIDRRAARREFFRECLAQCRHIVRLDLSAQQDELLQPQQIDKVLVAHEALHELQTAIQDRLSGCGIGRSQRKRGGADQERTRGSFGQDLSLPRLVWCRFQYAPGRPGFKAVGGVEQRRDRCPGPRDASSEPTLRRRVGVRRHRRIASNSTRRVEAAGSACRLKKYVACRRT